ncbi:hypothetical protein [Glutamicibacter sp. TV12E]|uniref:hypothetical protein n=1 Tax=Glutamicibacter sp. TV12E TaxID=3446362 RepID=UPI00403361ED
MMMTTHARRAKAKGKWMKLRDPAVLKAFIDAKAEMNQSKLAEFVGCERQFISALVRGKKSGCTPKLGEAIEDVLGAPRNTIFMPGVSIEKVPESKSPRPAAKGRVSAGKLRVA